MPSAAEQRSEQEAGLVHLTRLLKAPRLLVWKVWTQPEHLVRWFGPHAIAVTNCTIDLRPGGIIRFTHEATDGSGLRINVQGRFDEVVAPELLVIRFGFVDNSGEPAAPSVVPDWPIEARLLTIVSLAEHEQGTLLTIEQVVTPDDLITIAAVREERRMARAGWAETLDRLEALVAAEQAGA
jgi:uncharacterized protein YndB with AHSA1/START domain